MPLLTPLGIGMRAPWLAPLIVFGLFPVLGLLIGEDRSLPPIELSSSRIVMWYLHNLPRIYALVWISVLIWAARYAARSELTPWAYGWLIVSVGIGECGGRLHCSRAHASAVLDGSASCQADECRLRLWAHGC